MTGGPNPAQKSLCSTRCPPEIARATVSALELVNLPLGAVLYESWRSPAPRIFSD